MRTHNCVTRKRVSATHLLICATRERVSVTHLPRCVSLRTYLRGGRERLRAERRAALRAERRHGGRAAAPVLQLRLALVQLLRHAQLQVIPLASRQTHQYDTEQRLGPQTDSLLTHSFFNFTRTHSVYYSYNNGS